MKVAVVGGGLAGLTAALDLVDAGVEVTLYEARPTLGGAVQTLPARSGDPEPPPDNGQHIALGCFVEYLRLLDRIGEGGSVLRTRLALPVIAEDGSVSSIRPTPAALVTYGHLPLRDRLRIPLVLARLRKAHAGDGETFGALLRRLGASDVSVDPLLGRLHPARPQPPGRRGRCGRRALHRADGAPRAACERRSRAAR